MQGAKTGESTLHESGERDTGEPDALKGARPVRRGADGKGPERSGTSPAAYPTIYPQLHLVLMLAWSGADVERAEALARSCFARARTHPDASLLRALHTTLMWVATRRGNWEEMRAAFEASLPDGGP